MMNEIYSKLWFVLLFLCFSFMAGQSQVIADKSIPVYDISSNTYISNWITAGPYPNHLVKDPKPGESDYYAFDTDFLKNIGGESKAVLKTDQKIIYKREDQGVLEFSPKLISAGEDGIVDFNTFYGETDYKAAYAFCEIYSEKDQGAFFLFGSDDAAKVWINGQLVHAIDVGRGITHGQDSFTCKLKKGYNPVLIKITDLVREWGFVIESLDSVKYATYLAEQRAKEDLDEFLKCNLEFKQKNIWNYFFTPGQFPELVWEKPYLTEKVMGKFPLQIQWFNNELKEVKTADKPGRYAFYAEGTTKDGIFIRRAKTIYCMPQEWVAWGERPKANLDYLPLNFVDKQAWEKHKDAISEYTGRIALLSILNQQEGAVLMSYLDEMENNDQPVKLTDTPLIKDHEFHLALKRKILGVENKWPELKLPAKNKDLRSNILHNGSEKEAGVKKGTADKIKNVCQKWYEDSKEPFVTLIARDGVIIFHEAFGERPDGKITLETTSEIASITKLLTGLMFAQFIEQGLIDLDDPVGKYLPDFQVTGDKVITLRQCFTHTAGLWGHEEWGGVHNPWMDNLISNILKELTVGKKHEYNGMGYNLAGKVMEIVSGKSIFRLIRENFFDPLGLNYTILEEDLAFSCHTNAGELAVIGQMLLNKGSYGDLKFFSEKTYEKIIPKPLNLFYPGINNINWGVGITEMFHKHPKVGQNGYSEDLTILSKNMIGHGSATSAILEVDPDNGLVISQTRRRGGNYYNKYLEELLIVIEESLLK